MPKVGGWTPLNRVRTPVTPGAARFTPGVTLQTHMKEASDVTALPNGRFLVVGDQRDWAVIIGTNGERRELDLPGLKRGKSQLEGVAFDAAKGHLFVSREEAREVLRYSWDGSEDSKASLDKTFDVDAGGPLNKGIEGLAYLSGDVSPTGTPQLLLAKEGKPRELSLLADSGKGKPLPIKLEKEVRAVCRDFSAATIDPKTGDLFISSDESATVAQVKLFRDGDKVRGRLIQAIPMRTEKGKALERIEGLAFDAKGNLFVLTENDGELHQLSRK